ncbi:hypothetical protein LTR56_025995 [Elasticomyces elasticus]|nr:hypothetical protein LTR56_025995 [Elasticomyces elasticus]
MAIFRAGFWIAMLFLLPSLSDASSLHGSRAISPRDSFVFPDDSGCSAPGQQRVKDAVTDALALAKFARRMFSGEYSKTLRLRYFSDAATVGSDIQKSVQGVYSKIENWYPYWFFDGWRGKKINIYCKDPEANCHNPNWPGTMGYARNNYANGPRIFFCPIFFDPDVGLFGWPTLADRKKYLEKKPQFQKTVKYYSNGGQVLLHEMMHLQVISGNPEIPDYTGDGGRKFYGPFACERLARNRNIKQYAHRNADNYAWYANARWAQYYYGEPNPSVSSTGITLDAPDDEYISDDPFAIWNASVPYAGNEGEDNLDGPINTGPLGYAEVAADQVAYGNALGDLVAPPGAGLETDIELVTGLDLRILPLGDSITQGYQSSDGNGYRQDLLTLLAGNNTVDYVGTLTSGTDDNQEQGIDGATIAQIQAAVAPALALRPNVVLLHAGTNA